MKLYVDSTKPEVGVWCVGRVIKVNVGLYPLGIVAELAMWLCCSVMLMGVFLFLDLRLLWGCMSGIDYEGSWVGGVLLGMFLIFGTVLSGWSANYLMMEILPFSASIDIDAKTMYYGNMFCRRKCQLGDEVLLLVEPCYAKGDWGFKMKIISRGRKCLLLPGIFVGSYYKTRSQARNLAKMIQSCAPFVTIEESKYWRWH